MTYLNVVHITVDTYMLILSNIPTIYIWINILPTTYLADIYTAHQVFTNLHDESKKTEE